MTNSSNSQARSTEVRRQSRLLAPARMLAMVFVTVLTAATVAALTAAAVAALTTRLLRPKRQPAAELVPVMAELELTPAILSICMYCRRVRDDVGEWTSLESYVRDHAGINFSHGVCPSCQAKGLADFGFDVADETP